jgi:hydroxymethylbilane synthase
MSKTYKIGTRGSALALTQTNMVKDALAQKFPDIQTEIVIIKTSGDWTPEQGETRLKEENGGKGQFAKEIEEAMLRGDIDLAVHSMKDMETTLPDGLVIKHMLPREDPRDALLVHDQTGFNGTIESLPAGTVFGTASVRRQAFLLARNPQLDIVPLRGNVQTRIDKMKGGQVQATMLAYAGLRRLDLAHEATSVLDIDTMLPAGGQGAVGIEMRADDTELAAMLDEISCVTTTLRVYAERAVLEVLDGSCHTPIGSHATFEGERMSLRACLVSLDGTQMFEDSAQGNITTLAEATAFGEALGHKLKAIVPPALLAQKIDGA